ncbi:hypothetical protein VTO42DRAFT_1096 [Malbranchea cinnamomea]
MALLAYCTTTAFILKCKLSTVYTRSQTSTKLYPALLSSTSNVNLARTYEKSTSTTNEALAAISKIGLNATLQSAFNANLEPRTKAIHCSNLPPARRTWKEMQQHKFRNHYLKAARIEVGKLEERGTHTIIPTPYGKQLSNRSYSLAKGSSAKLNTSDISL